MENAALIYPMFAMVVLTCIVLAALFRARVRSVAAGQVSGSYYKTYRGGEEPDASAQLSRHFANIFEAPTLFYVVCLAAIIVNQTAWPMHLLAWAYVLLRAGHAYIHTGRNKLRPRILVYFVSWIVLILMWVYVVVGVLLSA